MNVRRARRLLERKQLAQQKADYKFNKFDSDNDYICEKCGAQVYTVWFTGKRFLFYNMFIDWFWKVNPQNCGALCWDCYAMHEIQKDGSLKFAFYENKIYPMGWFN